jgi:glycerol-3-phosphate dehydrogenase (NAD(P)+)
MTGTVAILGAGAMGSAFATPFRTAGWEVRLWGTWLDDHLLAACRQGLPHPRTKVPLAPGTHLFDADGLAEALTGADTVVLAVASVGAVHVTELALPHMAAADRYLVSSKGFEPDADGRIQLLPDALRARATALGADLPPIVAVGGPCKANEVAAGRPTAAILACRDREVAVTTARALRTDAYRAAVSADESGVEVCAPMKNVYAIALGIADGLSSRGGEPFHNLKAAGFAQSVAEMMTLAGALGGDPVTATGLAGAGDLEVTGLSGRNRLYGTRIGAGERAPEALAAMEREELTVEGVPAARLAQQLVDQRLPELWPQLPLLRAIVAVLDGADDPGRIIAEAVLPDA